MLSSAQIRAKFLDFFRGKGHQILPSAPIVNRQDPTLMFTNAGMNPFKDYFLGHKDAPWPRVADTQKCLRVSGKHNDLEEVGVDSYHHTMFEMLGNWSFGDYFKEEAIAWAWELLTAEYRIDPGRLYVTIFEGEPADGLSRDEEAFNLWSKWISQDRILPFSKKDNFWEMGDSGPCGPCSEIHVDLRDEAERENVDARTLVNRDHPQVVEIWNLVFIQYNRKVDGSLEPLPARHVDTGMGLERLVMALQGKQSNYETDIFQPLIRHIADKSGVAYTNTYHPDAKTDMAMRVMADHIRAVAFTVADGEMPSSNGAGYVIRRILRRAVRYGYSFLNFREPVMHELVPLLARQMREVFPELEAQEVFVSRVVFEEEKAFLRTLEGGLKRLEQFEIKAGVLDGTVAFELYDTFGFPIDLTRLIMRERGLDVDEAGFETALASQKQRSRKAADKTTGDWEILQPKVRDVTFLGYDQLEADGVHITRYRAIDDKSGRYYQVVLDGTPFYPEGGGQVGDKGMLIGDSGVLPVEDTLRENDLIIHITRHLPEDPHLPLKAVVDANRRKLIENNHSATHLLHAALREVLGDHVQQKGSMLNDKYLRFDFSHFQKMTDEEIAKVEQIVNRRIRQNIPREEAREISMEKARAAGAMMLFGEKYGDTVRMITFDSTYSRELCGGCHVAATGSIGLFKITSESAVAAGVRRIEAITAESAEAYLRGLESDMRELRQSLKSQGSVVDAVRQLLIEQKNLRKELESLQQDQAQSLKGNLRAKAREQYGIHFLIEKVPLDDPGLVKDLIFQLEQELTPAVIVLGHAANQKPMLSVIVTKSLAEKGDYHAGNLVRELAKEIEGGGGGQPFYATAGGKNADNLPAALKTATRLLGLE